MDHGNSLLDPNILSYSVLLFFLLFLPLYDCLSTPVCLSLCLAPSLPIAVAFMYQILTVFTSPSPCYLSVSCSISRMSIVSCPLSHSLMRLALSWSESSTERKVNEGKILSITSYSDILIFLCTVFCNRNAGCCKLSSFSTSVSLLARLERQSVETYTDLDIPVIICSN